MELSKVAGSKIMEELLCHNLEIRLYSEGIGNHRGP